MLLPGTVWVASQTGYTGRPGLFVVGLRLWSDFVLDLVSNCGRPVGRSALNSPGVQSISGASLEFAGLRSRQDQGTTNRNAEPREPPLCVSYSQTTLQFVMLALWRLRMRNGAVF